jgi:hypothetical protein
MPSVMERQGDDSGDEIGLGTIEFLVIPSRYKIPVAAQDKHHRDDPVDVKKQPVVREQPRAADDNQSNG